MRGLAPTERACTMIEGLSHCRKQTHQRFPNFDGWVALNENIGALNENIGAPNEIIGPAPTNFTKCNFTECQAPIRKGREFHQVGGIAPGEAWNERM